MDRHQLLDEQRVAIGGVHDSRTHVVRHVTQLTDKKIGMGQLERLQPDNPHIRPRRSPLRSYVEQVRSCRAQQHQRRVLRERRDILDKVEQRRLGPMDVVEHEDERGRLSFRGSRGAANT
jgi:hypothetical protein